MKTILRVVFSCALLQLLVAASPSANGSASRIFLSRDHGNTWMPADVGFPADDGVNVMAIHQKRVFAGTNTHGVWLFEKNAWSAQSSGLPGKSRVISLWSQNNRMFAGLYRGGLYYTDNGGDSWQRFLGYPADTNIRALTSYAGVVYAGTDNGIYRINSTADTWERVLEGQQINSFTVDVEHIYAATNKGVSRSRDGGNWIAIYNRGAIRRVSRCENDIMIVNYSGQVYGASAADRPAFIQQDYFFPRVYFQLNNISPKIFKAEWRDVSTFDRARPGLPGDVQFNTLLHTPNGLLAAAGGTGDGC